jgi:hypothetical protein
MGDKASRMVHMSVRMVRKGDKMVRKSAGGVEEAGAGAATAFGASCRNGERQAEETIAVRGRLPVNV